LRELPDHGGAPPQLRPTADASIDRQSPRFFISEAPENGDIDDMICIVEEINAVRFQRHRAA